MTYDGLGCSMSVDPMKPGLMTAQVNTHNLTHMHTHAITCDHANGKQTLDVRCGHIQWNVTAVDIAQRQVFIWQRRDQVLNLLFNLLAKTTRRPLIYLACRLKTCVSACA